ASCSCSMCGMLIFNTAGLPSKRRTASTYEQVGSSPLSGASRVSLQRSSISCTTVGRFSSHAKRSGDLLQWVFRALEIFICTLCIIATILFRLLRTMPYAETKEQPGGIGILEARDMNHAVQLVVQHPSLKRHHLGDSASGGHERNQKGK